MLRRALDIIGSIVMIIALAPVLAATSCAVVVTSGWPFLFSQIRVGQHFRLFRIWKFRTMRPDPAGLPITTSADDRVTSLGRRLRAIKLDELPQLVNVFCGDMSFFGPRPEVPEFVERRSAAWQAILAQRPGLIDPASLQFVREPVLLAAYPDPVAAYRETFLPEKLAASCDYLRSRTAASDFRLLLRLVALLLRSPKAFHD